jgi:Domain of unknown function (DUF4400)
MSSSRFVAHVRLWFFIVPLLGVFVMPAIPDRSLFDIPAAESDSVSTVLGDERAAETAAHTNALFRHAFVESGVMRATIGATRSRGLNDGGVTDFAHTWVRNFWLLVYRVVYRATVMKHWLTGAAVFCVAAFVDGSMRRKIKASAAGFASPLSFHLAGHGILLVFGTAFAVLVIPIAVLAQCWIAVTACLGMLIWKASSAWQ